MLTSAFKFCAVSTVGDNNGTFVAGEGVVVDCLWRRANCHDELQLDATIQKETQRSFPVDSSSAAVQTSTRNMV